MAKRTYEFDYQCGDASCIIEVDTEIFTEEIAMQVLTFFDWDWDKDGDIISEIAKKYALRIFQLSVLANYSLKGIIRSFNDHEGFAPFGKTYGIQLKEFERYEFAEYCLDVQMTEE
ncbi:hypothetical protein [Sphingobacterium multivorum]|uniref:hypothetical protein n=1 Tax=Sphingobacterium multivorum TaxID=28454 RepID=UPI0026A491E3|nr:hypothetical protein [Sphingobacterium multivorum]